MPKFCGMISKADWHLTKADLFLSILKSFRLHAWRIGPRGAGGGGELGEFCAIIVLIMSCRILDTNNCIKYAQPTGRMRSGAGWLAGLLACLIAGWQMIWIFQIGIGIFFIQNIMSASLIFCLLLQHKKMEVKGIWCNKSGTWILLNLFLVI